MAGDFNTALLLLAALASVLGAAACLLLTSLTGRLPTGGRPLRSCCLLGAALSLGVGARLAHALALSGMYSFVSLGEQVRSGLPALALMTVGALAALLVAIYDRKGYRGALLGGAVLAGSIALTLFRSVDAITEPFHLAYAPLPVFATVLGAASLGGLGLAQVQRGPDVSGRLHAVACLAGSILVLTGASLASMMSFSDWAAQADAPASLAEQPIVVVVGSCGLVVVVLGAFGAAVDHYFALQEAQENARLRQLADSTFEGILLHRAGLLVDANAALGELVGVAPEQLRGKHLASLLTVAALDWRREEGQASHRRFDAELFGLAGERIPVELLTRTIAYKGEAAQVVAVRDMRERRQAEDRIRWMALHDGLTGLANRSLFNERLDAALQDVRRGGPAVAVLCVDLDRFKAVNDGLGHQAGDALLRQVAGRLHEAVRVTDTVARLGGDEFVVLQAGADLPSHTLSVAERLVQRLAEPFDLDGRQALIGCSIGIAVHPGGGTDADALLRSADLALYRAKADGRGCFRLFEASMDAQQRERRDLEAALRGAIGTRAIELHYQPQFRPGHAEPAGFEALMRWTHPAGGAVSPATFIPIAEETGLIVPLGTWALETACLVAASWPASCRVAVNVSPLQFRDGSLPDTVEAILLRTRLPAARLELEVTESLLIQDAEQALDALRRLKALGVYISLDDFGTGYSSLGYLQRFPFDKIKIDRSFVLQLDEDGEGSPIIDAILALGHSLGIEVTAEGVETPAQLAALHARKCDYIQGYVLGRPVPAAEAALLFAVHDPTPAFAA